MHACGCRNEEIRLTEGDVLLPASCHEAAPFQDHILVDRQHASMEPRPQLQIEPYLKCRPMLRVGFSLDAKPDLRKRDRAEEQSICCLRIRPRLHPVMRPGLAQFRNDVGVEQPTAQKSTSRTGLRTESPPNSRLASGDRDRRSCRVVAALRVRRRSNSSAATTTTAFRPRTVTRCGWPAVASRTTSLNRALASASFQPDRGGSGGPVRGRSGSRLPIVTILVKNRRDGERLQVQAHGCNEAAIERSRKSRAGWPTSHARRSSMLPPERMKPPNSEGLPSGMFIFPASITCSDATNTTHGVNRVGQPVPARPMTDSVITTGLTRASLVADVIGDHA